MDEGESENSSDDEEVDKVIAKKTKKASKSKDELIITTKTEEEVVVAKKTKKASKSKDNNVNIDTSNEIIIDSPTKNTMISTSCDMSNLDSIKKTELKENYNNTDYDNKFNKLKDTYIIICKEISEIQLQINNKDKQREDILKEIRQIQIEYLPQTNFGVMVNTELITDNCKTTSGLINKVNNINIKKPKRQTDMETDDSNSDYSDDLQCSDYESE